MTKRSLAVESHNNAAVGVYKKLECDWSTARMSSRRYAALHS